MLVYCLFIISHYYLFCFSTSSCDSHNKSHWLQKMTPT
jgi:hypothetical protein